MNTSPGRLPIRAAIVGLFCGLCFVAPAQDAGNPRDQAQAYFEADEARKAVAVLIDAARKDPKDRLIGALLYAGIRDHVWHMPQILPIAQKGSVTALAFSADEFWLASGSASGELIVSSTQPLDAAEAQEKRAAFPQESGIVGLCFSRDGKHLGVATKSNGARVIDLGTKEVVFSAPKMPGVITTFAVSKNADLFAVGSDQGALQVVDTAAGKVAFDAAPRLGEITALALSRSGQKLAAGCGDRAAHVWDLSSGRVIGAGVPHQASLRSIDFSYDERYVLSAGEAGVIRLSNPEEGIVVMPPIQCPALVRNASISPDGSTIATILDDATVMFWDAFTGAKRQFSLREDGQFNAFFWSQSGLFGATISDAGHSTLWTLRDGTRRGETIPQGSPVVTGALAPSSKLLATGSVDGKACIWRTDGGMPLPTVRSHAARARSAFYSADGNHLVTTAEDHTALHWISGQVNPAGPAMQHPGRVTCGTFNRDASRILTCDDSGVAQLWNPATSKPDGAPFKHAAPVQWVDFDADGKRIVTASGDAARIWSLAQRDAPIATVRHPGDNSQIKCARFSANGKWLATASTDGTARIWDAATFGAVGNPITRQFPVLCVRFSPDSSRLVVAGEDGQAVVYDTRAWQPVGTPVQAPGPVFSAAITPDNDFLVISSLLLDAVQFFDIATGQALGQGVPIPTQATCVDLHLQDKVVVIACDDGTVRAVDSPFVAEDVPRWVTNFAEILIGYKKTGPDKFERVDGHAGQLRALFATAGFTKEGDFERLARWKQVNSADRKGMPRFSSTIAANIQRRLEDRSLDALFECYEALSSDPRVLSAISLFLPNQKQGEYIADLVLKMDNVDALSRAYAAGTLVRSGRSQEAEVVMAKALEQAPNDVAVIRRIAKLHARMAKKDSAVGLFERAVQIEPNSAETRRSYGWALYNFRQPKEAAAQFRLAQDLVGELVEDIVAGLCLCAAAQEDLTEAKAQFNRLVSIDPLWKEADYISSLPGWSQLELSQLEIVRRGLFANQ